MLNMLDGLSKTFGLPYIKLNLGLAYLVYKLGQGFSKSLFN